MSVTVTSSTPKKLLTNEVLSDRYFAVTNTGSSPADVSIDPNVTFGAATAVRVAAGQTRTVTVPKGNRLFARTGSGTQTDLDIAPSTTPTSTLGAPGQGFSFRGAWAPNTQYQPYDVVTFSGRTYLSQKAFQSGAQFDSTNWFLMADKGNATVALATRNANVVKADPAPNTSYDVTDLTLNITGDGVKRFWLEAYLPELAYSGAVSDLRAWIVEGANLIQSVRKRAVAANVGDSFNPKVPIVPSAGVHTYKVVMRSSVGVAGQSLYVSADPTFPAWFRAFED